LQQQQDVEKENATLHVVERASDQFPPLPPIPLTSNTQTRNLEGDSKRRAYKRGRQNAAKWLPKPDLLAVSRQIYEEVFDTRSGSSKGRDEVTSVGRLNIGRFSLPENQDEKVLTREQEQQVAETFEQLGDLATQVELMLAQGTTRIKTLPPDEQRRVLVSVAGLLNHCHGREAGDPEVQALLSAIHRIAQEDGATLSLEIPSDRIKYMMHPAMQLAELKHLQDIISDPSFNPDDPAWKKFFVRWPLNFVISFVTVGLTVLLWTFVRGHVGNFIKSAYPDIAAATGMNATENGNVTDPGDRQARNSTSLGNSTLRPPAPRGHGLGRGDSSDGHGSTSVQSGCIG
jgi:hypothetical protein